MPIEALSSTAIKLPVDNISKQFNNQTNKENIQLFDQLNSFENQILSYDSKQFKKVGNDISNQIVKSLANLDLHLKNTQTKLLNNSDFVKTKESPKNLYYSNENSQNGMTELKRITNISRKFQSSMLTIKFVESFISAFHTTLNRFLKM